ncbi:MAG TPA: hypothetical protein VHF70_04875 [Rubrobacteraceae bacterium]|nr:hypothetical protein [Rubrobacteraceae bacterium]
MRRLPPAVIMTLVLSLVVASLLAACGTNTQSPESGESKAGAGSERSEKEAKIQSAMSAGPKEIAQDARIVDYPKEAGQPLVELREGTNEWTCFPDWEATPGEDPQCLDEMWMRWFEAISAGTDPNTTAPGMAYMLQGGSDASNTDPFAMEPEEGEEWVSSPPHVMLIVPGELGGGHAAADHHSGGPWVMYAGTPYEHLMVPVEGKIE